MDLTGIAFIICTATVLCLVPLELYRRMQRTRIYQLPGGLHFEAYNFSVQVRRQEQEVQVRCARGLLVSPDAGAGPQPPPAGPVNHRFAAVGFQVQLRECMRQSRGLAPPERTGYCDIVLRGADGTQLTIERVSAVVAKSFEMFFLQVRYWIDKLELRLERERVARLRSEEEAAAAQRDADLMAQLLNGKAPGEALSDSERDAVAAAQLAQWRSAAGFTGLHAAYQVDPSGRVLWFVDLAADGRITLHADKRTLHGSLLGAQIGSVSGGLEVGVRDAHWSEREPELRTFCVLRGRSAEERRAWKERMEILRNSLNASRALAAAAPELPAQVPSL